MSYVYLIEAEGGLVKVGVSKAPRRRRSGLQNAAAEKLRIVKTYQCEQAYDVEQRVHAMLAPWNKRGEWFTCGIPTAEVAIEAVTERCPQKAALITAYAKADIGGGAADWEALKEHLPLALRINTWADA